MAESGNKDNRGVWLTFTGVLIAAVITGVFGLFQGYFSPSNSGTASQSSELASPTTEVPGAIFVESETPTSTPEATPTATMPLNGDCSFTMEDEITATEVSNGHNYTFSANAGDVITLSIVGVGNSDPGYHLHDPIDARIATSTSSMSTGNEERLSGFVLPATGDYRLNVVSINRPMAYTVRLDCSSTGEPYPPPPAILSCGDVFNTEISVSEVSNGHNYTFSANKDDTITFSIVGVGNSDPGYRLHDPIDARIATSTSMSTGNEERLSGFVLPATGDYRLNVVSINRPMAYTLSFQCPD